ncbi:MAG TPA: DUF6455 family protein [Ancylobacter sp.]
MRIDTIDERLGLFRNMLDHAGIDPLDPAAVLEAELRTAAQRCLGCRVAEECRDWLRDVPEDSPPPGFCRNAERFQGWVENEIPETVTSAK